MNKIVDVAVIGSGGGTIIADTAMKTGHTVALIEGTGWGGCCLNHGCIPTKIMVHATDVIRETERADRMALAGDPLTVDWQGLRARVFEKIAEGETLPDYYADHSNISCYFAMASFREKQTVNGEELFCLALAYPDGGEEDLLARKVVIACGAHTMIPPDIGLDSVPHLTSESFFSQDGFPAKPFKSLMIIGGGDIGAEFAHIFSGYGTKVSIIQRNVRLVPKQDEEVSEKLLTLAKAVGIDVYLNQTTLEAGESSEGKTMRIRDRESGEEQIITAEEILVAPGIRGNAESLNLAAIGLTASEQGWITTNEYLETEIPGVYALGDINGKDQLRHKSNYEAQVLAYNLLEADGEEARRKAEYEVVPRATFTVMQIGSVGLTEFQARNRGMRYRVGYLELSATAQGYARGYLPADEDQGFAKILINEDDSTIIGVHIVAPEASSLVQSYVYLMAAARMENTKADSVDVILNSMTIHPSLSELPAWAVGKIREEEA